MRYYTCGIRYCTCGIRYCTYGIRYCTPGLWYKVLYLWYKVLYLWYKVLYLWYKVLYPWYKVLYLWYKVLYPWYKVLCPWYKVLYLFSSLTPRANGQVNNHSGPCVGNTAVSGLLHTLHGVINRGNKSCLEHTLHGFQLRTTLLLFPYISNISKDFTNDTWYFQAFLNFSYSRHHLANIQLGLL